jgi:imidazolonepropionase-like amidohydrolase
VDGVPEVQKETRRQLRQGIDFIKTCTTGGVGSPADRPDYTEWSMDELKAMVYEAKARGKEVMAHAEGTQGIKNAILGGVWSVEHGSILDDEAIQMMLDHGTFLVPTLYIVANFFEHGAEYGMTPIALEKARNIQEIHFKSFTRAVQAGVKIAMGTDCFHSEMHGTNARELALMVQYGMTPMQAIVASTKTSAEVCKIEKMVGTLQAGKLADLLVIDGNPLEDIKILMDPKRMLCVMKEGKKYVDCL